MDTVLIENQEADSIDPNTLETEDHPTGIKLRRVGYYTIPPMTELKELIDEDGSCFVDGFTIGRYDYGNVFFPDRFNVAGLDLDSIGKISFHNVYYLLYLLIIVFLFVKKNLIILNLTINSYFLSTYKT